ncbi:MAG TPA: outer membrane beta-barrel protein, partial [Gammaproteobacteria bacterium]|nr:outer membrane beta-barrel protein [Gammaproteobacteria bacterium]
KKILLASVIAALTTGMAIANPAPYVGASVGITNNTATIKVLDNSFTGGAYRGVPFNVFAGYGGVINQNFYLAGEVTGTVGTANISENTQLKTSYGYGASVIPGVMLSDHTLAFARAGVVRSRFSSNESNTWQNGGQLGLGMQTSLTQNVDLRTEYDFVAYEAKNYSVGSISASTAPRADQFSLGLVYKLD